MSVRVAIIDYGAGNLRSIRRALEAADATVTVTSDAVEVREADAVVFPGVGAAGAAMDRLDELGLVPVCEDVVVAGKPFLGICLGMQLLFEDQEEGKTRGLGLLRGSVRSLPDSVKVPQIGWNQVRWLQDGAGYAANEGGDFYFVHSYVVVPDDPADIVAVTRYGTVFPSIVRRENVWGTQFHPEKSGPAGLRMIAGWVDAVRLGQELQLERVPA
ncbi:MAG: imidazole glycerol phosphate synthase subunit HisH [Thermomicrobiales bacterium]